MCLVGRTERTPVHEYVELEIFNVCARVISGCILLAPPPQVARTKKCLLPVQDRAVSLNNIAAIGTLTRDRNARRENEPAPCFHDWRQLALNPADSSVILEIGVASHRLGKTEAARARYNQVR